MGTVIPNSIPELPAPKVFSVRVQSQYILTPTQIKQRLGIGYKVLSVEVEKEVSAEDIQDRSSAVLQIIKTGYRALARANHPDLGGDAEKMRLLNNAKKELDDVMRELL